MAKLEPWQRYRKASPCPVCAGYGAYRPENRCKGFLKADGSGAYCSNEPGEEQVTAGRIWFEPIGMHLYLYLFQEQGEGELPGRQVGRHRILLMWQRGLLRRQARIEEARRPPTGKDFG